jgi:hypothetical protein
MGPNTMTTSNTTTTTTTTTPNTVVLSGMRPEYSRLYLPAHCPQVHKATGDAGRYAMANVLLRACPDTGDAELVATDGRILVRTTLQSFPRVANDAAAKQHADTCEELALLPALQLPGELVTAWVKGRKSLARWIEIDDHVATLCREDGAKFGPIDFLLSSGVDYPKIDGVLEGTPKADRKDTANTTLSFGKEYLKKLLESTGGDTLTFTFATPQAPKSLDKSTSAKKWTNQVVSPVRVDAGLAPTKINGWAGEPTHVVGLAMPVVMDADKN